jgi:hypothetical protein
MGVGTKYSRFIEQNSALEGMIIDSFIQESNELRLRASADLAL